MYYLQQVRLWFGGRGLGIQITVKIQDRDGQNKEEEEEEVEEEKEEEENFRNDEKFSDLNTYNFFYILLRKKLCLARF
jgi:hypothetical protein